MIGKIHVDISRNIDIFVFEHTQRMFDPIWRVILWL